MSAHRLESEPFDLVKANKTFLAAAAKMEMVRQQVSQPIKWPGGLTPATLPNLDGHSPGDKITGPLTGSTDVLILLYTDQETEAFLDIFTGNDVWSASRTRKWYPYTHNFGTYSDEIKGDSKRDIINSGCFGYLLPMQVGGKKVLLYKTLLHPKNDGNAMPFIPVIKQLMEDVAPKLVLTTGTAGGIGTTLNCGDVVITDTAGLHCRDTYPTFPQLNSMTNQKTQLKSVGTMNVDATKIQLAQKDLLGLAEPGLAKCYDEFDGDEAYAFLKPSNNPTIYVKGQNGLPHAQPMVIVSADYLTVDDNMDSEQLQGLGSMNDTDDGFAAYAISLIPSAKQPQWLSVRNASEPQVESKTFPAGTSTQDIISTLENIAGPIYGVYQYCTTINSAFACWAIIAGMP